MATTEKKFTWIINKQLQKLGQFFQDAFLDIALLILFKNCYLAIDMQLKTVVTLCSQCNLTKNSQYHNVIG